VIALHIWPLALEIGAQNGGANAHFNNQA